MSNPFFYRYIRRNNKRRAAWHDYKAPNIYMITITKDSFTPQLSTIFEQEGVIYHKCARLGSLVEQQLKNLNKIHPALHLGKYIIMPDHIHFILWVSDNLEKHAAIYIGQFKGKCSRAWWGDSPSDKGKPLYESGFHDRIIMKQGQLQKIYAYIADNPRRLWIKVHNPQLFSVRHRLVINGEEFQCLGNVFLLDDFDKVSVRVSSRFSAEELTRRKRQWLHTIENGAVLVGAFISPAEQAVLNYAIQNDGRLIVMLPEGFGPKFKPSGQLFDLCNAGRALVVGKPYGPGAQPKLDRDWALHLNAQAEQVADDNFQLFD